MNVVYLYAFSLNKVNSSFCGLVYRNLCTQKIFDYQHRLIQFLLPSCLSVKEGNLRLCTSCAVYINISRATHCLA
jgi:hypothetical protein